MLLHLADTISNVGPAWVYWVFVMERLCGRLQRSVTSRRFPYSSMNSWATGWEQIKLLKKLFYLQGRLGALENKEKRELRNSVCTFFVSHQRDWKLTRYRPSFKAVGSVQSATSGAWSTSSYCSCSWDSLWENQSAGAEACPYYDCELGTRATPRWRRLASHSIICTENRWELSR
jgi:hypothetical protein